MQELGIHDVQKTMRDTFYVAVGLGVIAFQKAQVQRQELRKQLGSAGEGAQATLADTVKTVEERLSSVEVQIDAVLDDVETRLPEPARGLLAQARGAAKDARKQVRSLVDQL